MIYFAFTETERFVREASKILGDEGISELQLMNAKDLGEFEFAGETRISIAERSKSKDVFAVCFESDDEKLLVPMKIYKIGLRGDKARVIDEEGEVAIYPMSFFMVLPLAELAANAIEKHSRRRSREKALA